MENSGTKLALLGLVLLAAGMGAAHYHLNRPPVTGATEISLSFWGSYEEWAMWAEIVEGFEKKNPGIVVKMNYVPDNYDDKMRRLLASNTAPDVMLIQDEPFPRYASYGKFTDLTDWARGDKAPVDWDTAFWPTAAESFLYKDRVMGVPIWGGNVLVYYNRTMFLQLGVEPPTDDWTFDEFVAKAAELTRDLDGDGRRDTFGFGLPGWVYFLPWTWGFGASYLDPTHTQWTFTGPDALAASTFYQDLRFKYAVAPSTQEMPSNVENAMFMTNRLAMRVSGPWASPELKTAGIDFDVVHIPVGPTGERFTRVTWDALCLFSGSKHKDEALRFIEYCIGYEAQAVVGKYIRSVPALIAAQDAFMDPNNGWHEEKYIEALGYARLQPISMNYFEMNDVLTSVYDLLLLNKITPEEALERMDKTMREQRVFPIEEGS